MSHSVCTTVHKNPHFKRAISSRNPFQDWLFVEFQIMAIGTCVRWYLHVVWIRISLVTCDGDQFLWCLLPSVYLAYDNVNWWICTFFNWGAGFVLLWGGISCQAGYFETPAWPGFGIWIQRLRVVLGRWSKVIFWWADVLIHAPFLSRGLLKLHPFLPKLGLYTW